MNYLALSFQLKFQVVMQYLQIIGDLDRHHINYSFKINIKIIFEISFISNLNLLAENIKQMYSIVMIYSLLLLTALCYTHIKVSIF